MFENEERKKPSLDLLKRFVQKVNKDANIHHKIRRVDSLNRRSLLKTSNPIRADIIPISVTCKLSLPNTMEVVNKHWHIMNISSI